MSAANTHPVVLRTNTVKRGRSTQTIVHSAIDIKSWLARIPSVDEVRPGQCPRCAAASRPVGRGLQIWGHGLRDRQSRGPLEPLGDPVEVTLRVRRYLCRPCQALIVVVPLGVIAGRLFAAAAIGLALVLFGVEGFWRTLREGCLDFAGNLGSLHDVGVRLWAFLDQHYHRAPHAALLGRSPGAVFADGGARLDELDEEKLRAALTVRVRRRVRRDSTVPVDGRDWELDQGFLAGRLVTVARCMVDLGDAPWVEHEGKRLVLRPVDPVRNARRRRAAVEPSTARADKAVAFDPAGALLDRASGRRPVKQESQP